MVSEYSVRADGVPLYVEELTKAVAEPGAARGADAIPTTLAGSLMARLDRLSTAKEVAQRAAVLGREFGYPLLAAVAGMEDAGLRQPRPPVARSGQTRRSARPPRPGLRDVHRRLRDLIEAKALLEDLR